MRGVAVRYSRGQWYSVSVNVKRQSCAVVNWDELDLGRLDEHLQRLEIASQKKLSVTRARKLLCIYLIL